MRLPSVHFLLSTLAPQTGALPELPPGPTLDRVRGPIASPAYEPWQITLFCALSVVTLALLSWAAYCYIRARKKRSPTMAPETMALAELETAETLTPDDDQRFAVLCSLALRRYFENTLGIRSTAQTSEECLHSLQADPRFDAPLKEALARFLTQCDGMKFARQAATPQQRTALIHDAKQIIDQLCKPAHPLASSDPSSSTESK